MHEHTQDSRSTTAIEPICRYPGSTSCRGCEYSYAPDLYDGGCMSHLPEAERQRIRQTNPLPPRRV